MTPTSAQTVDTALLRIEDLTVEIPTLRGVVRPVDGVTLTLTRGKTTGLVGESGSGKSMTALAVMRLLPEGARATGRIRKGDVDLFALDERAMRAVRGDRVAMIFQEPMTSLNPVLRVGDQIAEALRAHRDVSRKEAWAAAVDMLGKVGVASPEDRARAYPHELSGGMRQRVMIATALICGPDVLVADEPTTALDVTIQAQILDLVERQQRALGMAVLLITHDLGVVAESCEDVAVMYAGRIVERAPVVELFRRPRHPYTLGLLSSVPSFARTRGSASAQRRLAAIKGAVPSLAALPSGCRFRDRCPRADDACAQIDPPLIELGPAHAAACIHPLEDDAVARAVEAVQ